MGSASRDHTERQSVKSAASLRLYDVESTVSEDLIVERSSPDVVQNPMQCLLPSALEMRHYVTSLHDAAAVLLYTYNSTTVRRMRELYLLYDRMDHNK